MRLLPTTDRRRGAIAPLAALLMTFIIGMVAFSVDVSWMVLTRSELQNAADSAALAGVQQLMPNLVHFYGGTATSGQKLTYASEAMTAARTKAKEYCSANTAGGKSNLTLLDSDIQFGYTNAAGAYTAYVAGGADYPNTIKVVVRRDGTANTPLGLFFGPVLGTSTTSVTANAGATLYAGKINSLNPVAIGGFLPMTFDIEHWKNFLATGRDPDGTISLDASGKPQVQIYPSVKDTGNFGELSLNDNNVGASTINGWIDNGMSAADVAALQASNLIPISAHNPNAWDWNGNPGMKASTVMNVNTHTGGVYILPLFKAYNQNSSTYQAGVGQGSNYNYNIVGFAVVRIQPNAKPNKTIIVQAGTRIVEGDVSWVSGSVVPAGSGTDRADQFYTTPKLTQ